MPTLQELREKRDQLNGELQSINKAVTERRAAGKVGQELWTGDDQSKFEKITTDLTTLDADIGAEERAESLEKHLATAAEARGRQTRFGRTDPKLDDDIPANHANAKYGDVFGDRDSARQFAKLEESRALTLHAWACEGRASELITDAHRKAMHELKVGQFSNSVKLDGHNNTIVSGLRSIIRGENTEEARARAYGHLAGLEKRSLGYDVNRADWVPVQFRDAFEIAFHGKGGVLPIVDLMITDSADTLPWPFADDIANTGKQVDEAVAENTTGADPEILVPKLQAWDFTSGFARVSKALLANSPFDLATMLGNALGERVAKAMTDKLTNGNRTNTMGGYMQRGAQAATVPNATPVSLAKLQDLIWSVIVEHRTAGTVALHDDTLRAFAALVDTQNQPLLSVGIAGSGTLQIAKNIIVPYQVNNYMDSVVGITAGKRPIAFGNFKQLKVRIVRAIRLERFNEKFAELHQAAFMANRSADADLLRGTSNVNCPIKYLQTV